MTTTLFYLAAIIAVVSTLLAITRTNAAHALLYLVVSLLAVAVVFYLIGAPLAGALEVIIYAGAIMVLFVFVIMMLNVGQATQHQEQQWLTTSAWSLPTLMCTALLAELIYVLQQHLQQPPQEMMSAWVSPKEVGILLYGPYLLAVELASMLLLAGLIGAYHLGRKNGEPEQ
ncbi:MAG: NADH-quinone oxidoreductase subunit J [Exilibacterium sp.]